MGLCVPACAKTQQERLDRDACGWRNKSVLLLHILALQHESTNIVNMAMDQYLYIPFLGGWTSIYQLFWCSPGGQGFDPSPYQGNQRILHDFARVLSRRVTLFMDHVPLRRFIEGETCNLKSSTTHPQVMRYGHHDTWWYDVKLTSHMYLNPKKVSIIAELVEDKFWLVVWNIFIFPYIGNFMIPTD